MRGEQTQIPSIFSPNRERGQQYENFLKSGSFMLRINKHLESEWHDVWVSKLSFQNFKQKLAKNDVKLNGNLKNVDELKCK